MKYFNLLLLVLISSAAMAGTNPLDKYNKTKRINKTYTVNSDALVKISNSFGDVTITSWDKNSVGIEVIVEVSGNDEESVNNRLRAIDVDFDASASKVSAVSNIPSENNSSFFGLLGSSSRTNTSVNYIVKMPRNSPLDVENNYGAIIIEKMTAPLTLSCDFGRLQIGQLLNIKNKLSFDYTDNSNIDYLKSGTIEADFSKFKIYGSDAVDFSGDYTTASFGPTKRLKYNSDFSTINIEDAQNINGRGDYSTIVIDKLIEEADLKASFGKITLKNLHTGFSKLTIKSDYTDVKVAHDRSLPFDFEINTEFGTLNLGSTLQTVDSRKDYNELYKKGYNGAAGAGGSIEINSSFGSVTLRER